MTASRRSPISGFATRRRTLLLGGTGGAAALALGFGGIAAARQRDESLQVDFDLENGNYIEFTRPTDESDAANSDLADVFGPMDVTVILWVAQLILFSWFDALAPYHPTAVGVHSRTGRRPSSESATNRNMNIACIYAQHQVVKSVLPTQAQRVRGLMTALGLDPDDESVDPTSPVGIGNIAGKATVRARERDGMNFLGDEGRTYNGHPFEDYTGYRPVNTSYDLVNPSRWQPASGPHAGRRVGGGHGDIGVFVDQRFITPHLRRVKPYSFDDPSRFRIPPPQHIDHTRPTDFKRSVDEILEASAALTDKQKMLAEVMDNKLWGLGYSGVVIARHHSAELDMHGWLHFTLTHTLAMFDALMPAWDQKVKYDSARPFSAVRHVYGSTPVTAWGGVGKGTVNDIPADEWSSYVRVGDHAEYPSGSTTLGAAAAQASRRYFGSDTLDWRFTVPAGRGMTEPGIAPANDVELDFPTWTDFMKICGTSRVWAGVHFKKTVERSLAFGEQFGDLAYEFVQRHINGDVRD
ncbi:hypothetical protein DMB38_29385 [Streptomyces sp. WAC 06738]|uniref:DUF6851 domain-containing protein n=1 Tax=Streptomyces sp. WAC 06738 TaxID=2203210 RepID=UPI000F6ECF51|nr:hypothetical protein [Streptomyces sp. WAC 06738]AZM49353.1 hypothetical protein DMB38_29385 [Streptomyces sp. WAC 06738]